jgi:hypothetical protein
MLAILAIARAGGGAAAGTGAACTMRASAWGAFCPASGEQADSKAATATATAARPPREALNKPKEEERGDMVIPFFEHRSLRQLLNRSEPLQRGQSLTKTYILVRPMASLAAPRSGSQSQTFHANDISAIAIHDTKPAICR